MTITLLLVLQIVLILLNMIYPNLASEVGVLITCSIAIMLVSRQYFKREIVFWNYMLQIACGYIIFSIYLGLILQKMGFSE